MKRNYLRLPIPQMTILLALLVVLSFAVTWTMTTVEAQSGPGILESSPASDDFGQILQGTTTDRTFTLTNSGQSGDQDIVISSMSISGSTNFTVQTNPSPVTLAPGETTSVTVRYAPVTASVETNDTATLVVNHDGTNTPLNVALSGSSLIDYDPIYRVNPGGSSLVDRELVLDWSADSADNPYPYANHSLVTSHIYSTIADIDYSSPTLPSYTPTGLFGPSRYDNDPPLGTTDEMEYAFPVEDGIYQVRLYLAETYSGTAGVGLRIFDAEVEGTVPPEFNDIDRFALAGAMNAGIMISSDVLVTDGTLNLRFLHQVENPDIQGIEIIPISLIPTSDLGVSTTTLDFGEVPANADTTRIITLTNLGGAGDPSITINDLLYSGVNTTDFSDDLAGTPVLQPGDSMDVTLTINPPSGGVRTAVVTIDHTGDNPPLDVTLQANATSNGELELSPAPFDFGQVAIGDSVTLPLTLTNLGELTDSDIEVTGLVVSGADTSQFQFEPYANPLIVPAGQSITVDVTFTPAQTGTYNVTLVATHDGTNSPSAIAGIARGAAPIGNPIYRVNVGGPNVPDPGNILTWAQDLHASPSPYHVSGGEGEASTLSTIDMSDPGIPLNTPSNLFQRERWDSPVGSPLAYDFPVTPGTYEVHIYVAETYPAGVSAAGVRVFDASVEGVVPPEFNDIDPYALTNGAYAAYMLSSRVTVTDGSLTLQFLHQSENPAVKAIEIYDLDADGILGTNPATYNFGGVLVGNTVSHVITLSNDGSGGAPPLTINDISFNNTEFISDFSGPVTLNEAETLDVTVSFTPSSVTTFTDTMTINHDGVNAPTTVGLSGSGSQANLLLQDVTAFDFGNVLVNANNDGTITLTNSGLAGDPDITITGLNFSGTDASEFSHSETLPLVIAPGTSEILDINLVATANGTVNAQLTIVNSGAQGDLTVDLTAIASTPAPDTYSVSVGVDPGGTISTSTTTNLSFVISNNSTAGQEISQVSLDISDAILPDLVFDPAGLAGDTQIQCLTPQSGTATQTGLLMSGDLCVDPFSGSYQDGYRILTLDFDDFAPSEFLYFSVDVDPTSIRGEVAPGPDNVGHISGYELIGSEVTVEFNDGTTYTTELWRSNSSNTGSQNYISNTVLSVPTIEVLGVSTSPTTVSNLNQTVRVTGPAGAEVSLLISEGDMVEPGTGGYDVDPFELNTVLNIQQYTDTIGAGGTVDIPITLLDDELIDGTYGGINVIVAVINDTSSNQKSALSNRIVLEYVDIPIQDITFAGNISASGQEGQATTIDESVGTGTGDGSTPTISLTAVDNGTGGTPSWLSVPATVVAGNPVDVELTSLSMPPGTYTATVTGSATGYNSATFTVTFVVNGMDLLITSPADSDNIVGTDVIVSWTTTGTLASDLVRVTLDDLSTPGVDATTVDSLPLNGSYTYTGVAPGSYELIVEITDDNLNFYVFDTQTVTFTVSAPPDPDILFSANVSQTAQEGQSSTVTDSITVTTGDASTPTINLSAVDDATTLTPTWLTIPATVTAGNSISVEIDPSGLPVGTHTATVTGSATGYTTATFTVTIVINDINVAISSPTNLANVVGTDVVVTWTSTGGLIDDHIHVTLDNLSTPTVESYVDNLPQNGTTTITGVAPGNYRVIVEMTDVNHIVYSGTAVSVDIVVSSAPLPDLIFAGNLSMTAQEGQGATITDNVALSTGDLSTPSVSLSAIDDGTGSAPTWLSIPATVTAGTNVAVDVNVINLAPGTHTATVTATASGYNSTTFTVTVVVNDLTIALSAPLDGATFTTSDTITVTWTSTNGLADDTVQLFLDDLSTLAVEPAIGVEPLNGTATITGYAEGNYAVIVDMANSSNVSYQGVSDSVNITIADPVVPAISFDYEPTYNAQAGQALVISDIVGTSTNDATTPTITLSVIDDFTQIAPSWLTLPATVQGGDGIAFSIDVDGLAPRTYTATVTGTATGYESDTITITLVVADVDVDITQPAPFASILSDEITVNWATTGAQPSDKLLLTLDNLSTAVVEPPVPITNLNGSYTFTGVLLGDYEITLQLVDSLNRPYYGAVDTHTVSTDPTTAIPAGVTGTTAPIGTISNAYPTFTWTPVTNATWYYFFINTPNAGSHTEWVNASIYCNATLCSYTPQSPFEDGVYEWAVKTSNANGHGPWSEVWDLTISGGSMNTVSVVNITDSASVNPTFRWNTELGASWYRLVVQGPTGIIHDNWYHESEVCVFSDCGATPALFITPGTYSYWVQPWGYAYVYGPWSPAQDVVMTAPVGQPITQIPAGTTTDTQPTFTWGMPVASHWHYIWLERDDGTIILQQWFDTATYCNGTTCTATPATLNLADGTYNWWIMSYGAGYGYTSWSNMGAFIVDTASGGQSVPAQQSVPVQQQSDPVQQVVPADPTDEATQPPADPTDEPTEAPSSEPIVLPTEETPTEPPTVEPSAESPTTEPSAETTPEATP